MRAPARAARRPGPAAAPPPAESARARRGALGRPEVALCLLAEVAYEHDEPFRAHLPLLLHAMLVALDAREPLVAGHARAVLAHLLHALAGRRAPPGGAGGGGQVARTLRHLAAGRGRRLWAAEDASLARPRPPSAAALGALANELVGAALFEPDLRERWAAEALRWALEAAGPRAAARSLQALGALRAAGGADAAAALTAALAACLACGAAAALDHAGQLLLALQAMVDGLPAGRLALFPQLVLAALAALCTPYVMLFRLALELAAKVRARCLGGRRPRRGERAAEAACGTGAGARRPGGRRDAGRAGLRGAGAGGAPAPRARARPKCKHRRADRGAPRAQPGSPRRRRGGGAEEEPPGAWPLGARLLGDPGLLAVQQLLVRGLFKPETELLTVEVRARAAVLWGAAFPQWRPRAHATGAARARACR